MNITYLVFDLVDQYVETEIKNKNINDVYENSLGN